MIQFTEEQIRHLREKRNAIGIKSHLAEKVKVLMESDILIPQKALATWALYYFCPEHSVRLIHDIHKMHEHRCPVDGQILTGEPYDGAWWVYTNECNGQGCYELSLLWILTGEEKYLDRARQILIEYAKYYPDYEIHGDIPHNKPGKAFSQTMSDAQWIRPLVMGYDLIRAMFTEEERAFIDTRLMEECGRFLMKNRIPQTHNHEVLISISVAMIGMVIDRQDMIDFGLYEKYGLRDQIDNALMEDGFWFEGSMHYQIYMMEMLTCFAKFSQNTVHSLTDNQNFKKMFVFPLHLIQPDGEFPRINDDLMKYGLKEVAPLYEFAYRVYQEESFAWILNRCYEKWERNSLESFLYGVDQLPDIKEWSPQNYHNKDGSGLTVFRGNKGRYLLMKHSPFGGEHDHYDRMGISFLGFGEKIAVDLGTTGYGAALHYGYYKNTGSHNTVVINEENQPPANPRVLRYEEKEEYTLLDTQVVWEDASILPNCHTRVEWDHKSYCGAAMRRMIVWCEGYFIDIFRVWGVQDHTIDWVLHVGGEFLGSDQLKNVEGVFSTKKPFCHIKNVGFIDPVGVHLSSWRLKNSMLNLYSYCDQNTLYYGQGPDNPSVEDVSYMINRAKGSQNTFIHVFEACQPDHSQIKGVDVSVQDKYIEVHVSTLQGDVKHGISL